MEFRALTVESTVGQCNLNSRAIHVCKGKCILLRVYTKSIHKIQLNTTRTGQIRNGCRRSVVDSTVSCVRLQDAIIVASLTSHQYV